jgi:hypothetical protein
MESAEPPRPGDPNRLHRWVLLSPFLIFLALLPLGWNPIYPGILAMVAGAALTVWCRPDLWRSTILGAGVFGVYYALFLSGLEVAAPGYIDAVWAVIMGLTITSWVQVYVWTRETWTRRQSNCIR